MSTFSLQTTQFGSIRRCINWSLCHKDKKTERYESHVAFFFFWPTIMRRRNPEHGFQRAARRLGITVKRKQQQQQQQKNASQIFSAAVRHCRDDAVLMLTDSITMATTDIPLFVTINKRESQCWVSSEFESVWIRNMRNKQNIMNIFFPPKDMLYKQTWGPESAMYL